MLSEEPQEATNQLLKKYCEHYSHRMSRVKNNEDLLRRLLYSSDPYISSLRKPQTANIWIKSTST